jgi:mannitol-1-phosphate/altronate dehydrogenase
VLTLDQRGQPWPVLALALAAWIGCLETVSPPDEGKPPPRAVSDPLAAALAPLARRADPGEAVQAVLRAVPGLVALAERSNACAVIAQALATLRARGPRESIQRLTGA